MEYLNAFLCGGILCAIGQILIDKTQLTPARILTGYVVVGVLVSALGLYQPLADWGGAGATVPLTGFGHALAKGEKGRGRTGLAGDSHRGPQRHGRRHYHGGDSRRGHGADLQTGGQAVAADIGRRRGRSPPAAFRNCNNSPRFCLYFVTFL